MRMENLKEEQKKKSQTMTKHDTHMCMWGPSPFSR